MEHTQRTRVGEPESQLPNKRESIQQVESTYIRRKIASHLAEWTLVYLALRFAHTGALGVLHSDASLRSKQAPAHGYPF